MKNGNTILLDIEKLNSEGAGIARYNNFVIFVKNSCPGDRLKCKITKVKKNYAEAEIEEIITPSAFRVSPMCKLQKICGGCTLQHIEYSKQLSLKQSMVEDTLHSILGEKLAVNKPISSGKDYGYRCKIQYPVRNKSNNGRLYAGYFRQGSHELINIKYCPIHPEICDKIIEFVKTEGEKKGISGYNEQSNSGILKHIVLRYSKFNNEILVILVINTEGSIPECVKLLLKNLYDNFNKITGAGVNFNNLKTNVILGEKTKILYGKNYIEEKLADFVFKIGADTFFQVNPECAELMFKYIKTYITDTFTNPRLLDAYAGIAAFGITLSPICKNVVSVEINKQSVENAQKTIKENDIKNVEVITSDSLKYIKQTNDTFDITILDPPRKGCGEELLKEVLRITKNKIIYVSCSPKSLATDLKYLLKSGCKVENIQPFDMFPNTFHVENVAVISTPSA